MLVFCTLYSKEYERQGNVLLKSIRQFHPESRIYILALDNETEFDEKFEITTIRLYQNSQLNGHFSRFLSEGRSRPESIYAIKPLFLPHAPSKVLW